MSSNQILLAKRLVFLAAIVVIGILSLAPQEMRPQTGFWDGWEHSAAYFVLGLCGLAAWPENRQRIAVIVLVVLYGTVLELLQGLLPARVPSLSDGAANAIGAGLAWLVMRFYDRLTRPR